MVKFHPIALGQFSWHAHAHATSVHLGMHIVYAMRICYTYMLYVYAHVKYAIMPEVSFSRILLRCEARVENKGVPMQRLFVIGNGSQWQSVAKFVANEGDKIIDREGDLPLQGEWIVVVAPDANPVDAAMICSRLSTGGRLRGAQSLEEFGPSRYEMTEFERPVVSQDSRDEVWACPQFVVERRQYSRSQISLSYGRRGESSFDPGGNTEWVAVLPGGREIPFNRNNLAAVGVDLAAIESFERWRASTAASFTRYARESGAQALLAFYGKQDEPQKKQGRFLTDMGLPSQK